MRRVVKAENLECVGRLHGGALYFCLFAKGGAGEGNCYDGSFLLMFMKHDERIK